MRRYLLAMLFCFQQTPAFADGNEAASFAIQASVPYQIADLSVQHIQDHSATSRLGMSAEQIACLAAQSCGPANLIVQDQHKSSLQHNHRSDKYESVVQEVRCATAHRMREDVASIAAKLHYGIAACEQASQLLDRMGAELEHQLAAQQKLIDEGVPLADPLLLDRLKITWHDQVLENQSKQKVLRIQLSELIGPKCACEYQPNYTEELIASDVDVCVYLRTAMQCRHEISLLKRLRSTIDETTLELWDELSSFLIGAPALRAPKAKLISRLKRSIFREDVEQAVRNRRRWLEMLIEERTGHIQKDVEVAYEKKKTAALRWANAVEQPRSWGIRVLQLEKIGEELKGNLPEQSAARLNRIQSESAVIERWLDWHQANVDLKLAAGTLLIPGELENAGR